MTRRRDRRADAIGTPDRKGGGQRRSSTMFESIASGIHRARWWLLAAMAVLFAAGLTWGPGVVERLDPGGFTVEGGEHDRAMQWMARYFEEQEPDVVALYRHPSLRHGDPKFDAAIERIASDLREHPRVAEVTVPSGQQDVLVSHDGRVAVVLIGLRGDDEAKLDAYPAITETLRDTELDTQVGGRMAAYVTAQETARSDLVRAELIALPALFVLLVWFFRSIVASVLPLLIGGVSIVTAMLVLRGLTLVTDLSLLSLNVVTFLGLGLAVDYSLFIVRRHREELARLQDVKRSLRVTIATAGRTIVFSGIAVAASLLGLLWFDIPLLRSIAIGGTVITLATLMVSLLFLPALLALVGKRIDAWRIGPRVREDRQAGLWYRLAWYVMRRPVLVTVVVTMGLLALASPVRRLEIEAGDAGLLPERTEVRQVWDQLRDPAVFDPGQFNPLQLVVQSDRPFKTEEGMGRLFDYGAALEDIEGVKEVHSVVTSGKPRPRETYERLPGLLPDLPAGVRERVDSVLAEHHALLRIVLDEDPSSDEAVDVLGRVREATPPGMSVLVGGRTVMADELRHELLRKGIWALLTIAGVTFVVLFFAFGSFVIPFKAIFMNMLSVLAAYGVLVWVFQDGHFEALLGFQSPGAIDPTILAVTFAVMFGLSMDYEVFLLSRIREEYDASGDNEAAVAKGVGTTARVITGAALILLAVVVGFVAGEMIFIKELGVGMGVAVIVDATVVRALLVPATMRLMGHVNWWAPGPLRRWWERSGIGVDERAATTSEVLPGDSRPASGGEDR